MTLEQLLAGLLCAAAERASRKQFRITRSFAGPRMERVRQLLRWAGALARYYELIPKREEQPDDDGTDELDEYN